MPAWETIGCEFIWALPDVAVTFASTEAVQDYRIGRVTA